MVFGTLLATLKQREIKITYNFFCILLSYLFSCRNAPRRRGNATTPDWLCSDCNNWSSTSNNILVELMAVFVVGVVLILSAAEESVEENSLNISL